MLATNLSWRERGSRQFQKMDHFLISGYKDFTWIVFPVLWSYFIGQVCFSEINKASLSLQSLVIKVHNYTPQGAQFICKILLQASLLQPMLWAFHIPDMKLVWRKFQAWQLFRYPICVSQTKAAELAPFLLLLFAFSMSPGLYKRVIIPR